MGHCRVAPEELGGWLHETGENPGARFETAVAFLGRSLGIEDDAETRLERGGAYRAWGRSLIGAGDSKSKLAEVRQPQRHKDAARQSGINQSRAHLPARRFALWPPSSPWS
jgi:hypothetical protein